MANYSSAINAAAFQQNLVYGQQSTMAVATHPCADGVNSSQWNPVSTLPLYRQQTTAATMPSYANTANSTNTFTSVSSVSGQYNLNPTYSGATQPPAVDYSACYSSYLQSMGMPATNSYVNMPVSSAATNQPTFPGAIQTNEAYAARAVAYANEAAAYYSALYGLGSYADPSQSQLYNYLHSYNNTKPS